MQYPRGLLPTSNNLNNQPRQLWEQKQPPLGSVIASDFDAVWSRPTGPPGAAEAAQAGCPSVTSVTSSAAPAAGQDNFVLHLGNPACGKHPDPTPGVTFPPCEIAEERAGPALPGQALGMRSAPCF